MDVCAAESVAEGGTDGNGAEGDRQRVFHRKLYPADCLSRAESKQGDRTR